MDLVFIGSGNVAAVLGRKFIAAGHKILQIVSRNASTSSELAYEWDTFSTNYFSAINTKAEVYIVAVPDEVIEAVVKELNLPGNTVVAHTAASVPMDVLSGVTKHYGVFYPLQSLRREMSALPEIPIFYEGNDELAQKKLGTLANSISRERSHESNNDERMKMHVAAVTVSNFTNHLFALAEEYCRKEGVDFSQLIPLIEETATRLKTISPAKAQTGPAIRQDQETLQKHLALLESHPRLKKIYELFTQSIQES